MRSRCSWVDNAAKHDSKLAARDAPRSTDMESQGSAGNEASTIELRLRRLEDIEGFKKLNARYCEACDGGWDARACHDIEKIFGLCAKDGVWQGGANGGHERLAVR